MPAPVKKAGDEGGSGRTRYVAQTPPVRVPPQHIPRHVPVPVAAIYITATTGGTATVQADMDVDPGYDMDELAALVFA